MNHETQRTTVDFHGSELIKIVDSIRKEEEENSFSSTVRFLVKEALRARGLWPPSKEAVA